MPKRSQLCPTYDPARGSLSSPWRVNVSAKDSMSGKRERYFFPDPVKAEKFAEELRRRLRTQILLSPAQQKQAVTAFELLKPYNISLTQVVQEWISGSGKTSR